MNHKRSSSTLASEAAKALNNSRASATQRSLAASVLSQRNPHNQTGAIMEDKASRVLQSNKYGENLVFIGNILPPGIVLYEAAAIVKHIASGGEVAALIDADIPPVCLIVDVVD